MIKNKLENIRQIIKELRGISFAKVSKEIIIETLEKLKEILEHYNYFDTSYSEGIYEKDANDPRAVIIKQSKNVIRDDFDYIFFKENGLLENLIKSISILTKVDTGKIRWYRVSEVKKLVDKNKKISLIGIEIRKKSCVFNRDNFGHISFLSGNKAESFIKKFEKELEKQANAILRGVIAHGKGQKIRGKVSIIHRDYSKHQKLVDDMGNMKEGAILVTTTTDTEFMPALKKASAVIADIGGLLSHAAISARELNIPCIVGTENATKILKDGDLVEVDADKGVVRILERAESKN